MSTLSRGCHPVLSGPILLSLNYATIYSASLFLMCRVQWWLSSCPGLLQYGHHLMSDEDIASSPFKIIRPVSWNRAGQELQWLMEGPVSPAEWKRRGSVCCCNWTAPLTNMIYSFYFWLYFLHLLHTVLLFTALISELSKQSDPVYKPDTQHIMLLLPLLVSLDIQEVFIWALHTSADELTVTKCLQYNVLHNHLAQWKGKRHWAQIQY